MFVSEGGGGGDYNSLTRFLLSEPDGALCHIINLLVFSSMCVPFGNCTHEVKGTCAGMASTHEFAYM